MVNGSDVITNWARVSRKRKELEEKREAPLYWIKAMRKSKGREKVGEDRI